MAALPALADPATPAPAPNATPAPKPPAPNATPAPAPKPPASKLDELKTADELWAYFQALKPPPQGEGGTPEEKAKALGEFVKELRATAERFASKYPADPRRWEARLTATRLSQKIANTIPQAEVEKPKKPLPPRRAPADIKARVRLGHIQCTAKRCPDSRRKGARRGRETSVNDFPNNDQLPVLAAQREFRDRRDPRGHCDPRRIQQHPNAAVEEAAARFDSRTSKGPTG
jgi:hypothetical protein